jgi:hypothetical protein
VNKTPEPCTNYHHTRRHYSASLVSASFGRPGREGTALCGSEVFDEDYINAFLAECFRSPVAVNDLPECLKCVARLETSG